MKKFIVILLTLLMTVSLVACAGNNKEEETSISNIVETTMTENTSAYESTAAEKTTVSESNTGASETESENVQVNETELSVNDNEMEEVKILVAYFSATNTTERVAKYVADGIGADLYEIIPENPYTDADLNYNNDNSRSTIEMNNSSARPAISGSIENMEQYTIVFIGYPIWWGEAPRIVSTFMESYDFSGKIIVPFCTSGGSGIGSSASNLAGLTEEAEWLFGQRLNGNISRDEIVEWVNGLGLDATAE